MGHSVFKASNLGKAQDAKAIWESASKQVLNQLENTEAKHRYTDLGDVFVATAELNPSHELIISAEGPPTISLTVVLEGAFESRLDNGPPLVLSRGRAVLLATEGITSGKNRIPGNQVLRFVDVRFDGELLREIGGIPLSRFAKELYVDGSLPERHAVFISFIAGRDLLEAASRLYECNFEDTKLRNMFLRAKALEALALTIGNISAKDATYSNFTSRDIQKIAEARALIQDRYEERWTIAMLARTVGINEKKLKAGFRRTIGESVHAYLRDIRLKAAAEMLLEGRSVTDVALSVGFGNLSHFSKVFKEIHGVSPSDYAKREGVRA